MTIKDAIYREKEVVDNSVSMSSPTPYDGAFFRDGSGGLHRKLSNRQIVG